MSGRGLARRDFLRSGLVAIGAALAGPSLWRAALAAPAQPGAGPYGPLRAPDANGIMLPDGFTSRLVARSGDRVEGTSYIWHDAPDGGATFAADDGGWIYVSNSEISRGRGGVGAVRFDPAGRITDAYSILYGTSRNCAGGATPWGTWLSCEEVDEGRVWECDPRGDGESLVRPAMGVFNHEAAAVDPSDSRIYLTEDVGDGCLYRFTPAAPPDLRDGALDVAVVEDLDRVLEGDSSALTWRPVPDPSADRTPTRRQVRGSTRFDGGEGCWFDAGIVYFTTKGDDRVWAYRTAERRLELLYDAERSTPPILTGVDNVFVSRASGDVMVAEDGGDLDIVIITPDRTVARLLKLVGDAHVDSEVTGPALSPAGDRLYFSSQDAFGRGATYEVRGPFRATRSPASVPSVPPAAAPSGDPVAKPAPSDTNGGGGRALTGAAAALGAVAVALGARHLARRRSDRADAR